MRRRAGWLLLAGYVAIAMPVVAICVLFVVNAQKHLGANYISFSTEVVRGQQDAARLRSAAEALMRDGGDDKVQVLQEVLTVIETRKATVLHAMERPPFADMDLDDIRAEFRRLQADLARIATLGRVGTLQQSSVRSALRARVFVVEDDVAFIYSELHKRVVSASAAQQRLMERLSYALLTLVAVVLVGLGALLMMLHQLQRQRRELEHRSATDDLTGLSNRATLVEQASDALSLARRSQLPCSVALIDIDHFKRINDDYGHPVGDRVLEHLGAVLRSSVRASDAVSRVGGEEFCILMPNTRVRESLALCARIRDAIVGEPCPVGPEGTLSCTVSIGVATTQAGGRETFEVLYARADAALYAAKRGGRDRIFHENEMPSGVAPAGPVRRAREY